MFQGLTDDRGGAGKLRDKRKSCQVCVKNVVTVSKYSQVAHPQLTVDFIKHHMQKVCFTQPTHNDALQKLSNVPFYDI